MRVTLQSTSRIIEASGIECRVWEGETTSGIKVQALIPRIAALKTEDLSEFESELQEQQPPCTGVMAFPLRMIL